MKKRFMNWKKRLWGSKIRMRFSKLIWRDLVENFENHSRHSSSQARDQRSFLIRSFLLKTTIQRLKADISTWWTSFERMKIISIRNRLKQLTWFNALTAKQSSTSMFIELSTRIISSLSKWCFKCSKRSTKTLIDFEKSDKNIWISNKILKKSSSFFTINSSATIDCWSILTECWWMIWYLNWTKIFAQRLSTILVVSNRLFKWRIILFWSTMFVDRYKLKSIVKSQLEKSLNLSSRFHQVVISFIFDKSLSLRESLNLLRLSRLLRSKSRLKRRIEWITIVSSVISRDI